MKGEAVMASKTLKAETESPVIDMAEFGARIAKRKAALGIVESARSSPEQSRRTQQRRAPDREQKGAAQGN